MKILICAIAKNENKYIEEWVDYYYKLGVTKIVLYDNNDIDGERFDDVLSKYIKNGFVEIVDYRGKHKSFSKQYAEKTKNHGVQQDAYEDCYTKYSNEYDWFGFFDIDEFLHICNNVKLKDFLSSEKFKNVDAIQFNWLCFGDNGLLRYENKPVRERFKTKSKLQSEHVKTMIRGGFKDVQIPCHIAIVKNGRYAYPNGKKTKCDYKQPKSLECAYVEHYLTKTIEEWCDRKFGTTSATGKDYFNDIDSRIRIFFTHNEKTEAKKKIIEQKKKQLLFKDEKVIVSLTSYKERFGNLIKVLDSIYDNTIQPEKIVLTIETREKSLIPKELVDYIEKKKNIEVLFYDENLKCHLKYFCTMKKYRTVPIITIDDDHIYTEDLIESLLLTYKEHPQCICVRRVHKMEYNNDGTLKKYREWSQQYCSLKSPSMDLFATGVGGVLYPPNILNISDDNLSEIRECLNADDVYLKYLEDKKNIPVVWVANKHLLGKKSIKENQEHALMKKNVTLNQNDIYISRFLKDKSGKSTAIKADKKIVAKKTVNTKKITIAVHRKKKVFNNNLIQSI